MSPARCSLSLAGAGTRDRRTESVRGVQSGSLEAAHPIAPANQVTQKSRKENGKNWH